MQALRAERRRRARPRVWRDGRADGPVRPDRADRSDAARAVAGDPARRATSRRAAPSATSRPGPPTGSDAASSGRPVERPAAHQVDVEVVDGLAAPAPDVRDEPVAGVGDALRSGEVAPRPRTAGRAAARPPRSARRPTRCARRGMSRMWVGARGAMSRMATTRSSSWSRVGRDLAGDDPAEQAVGDRGRDVAPVTTAPAWSS